MEIINRTPYALERCVVLSRDGRETLLVVVKGTFTFGPDTCEVAAEQRPPAPADEYNGDPARSGVRLASDFLPLRPATDVTLCGHAVAPRGPVTKMPVGLKVGPLVQKAWVFGERRGFQNIGRPAEFERMPLRWENAFGGHDTSHDDETRHDALPENPVGKGFIASRTKLDPDTMPLPNVEHPNHLLTGPGQRPPPVGFAPVAPFWEPRRSHGGTYDDAWVQQRAPLLPDDFDERFLQVAPRGLTADGYLAGDEEVELLGLTPEGRLRFRLEARPPTLGLRMARSGVRASPALESIHFLADERELCCTWKHAFDVQGKVEAMVSIEARIL